MIDSYPVSKDLHIHSVSERLPVEKKCNGPWVCGTVGTSRSRERVNKAIVPEIRRTNIMRIIILLAACGLVLSTAAGAHAQPIDWAKIDGIFGRTGPVAGAVHRWGFPRSDLQVTLDGVTIRPTLAL